MHFVHWVPHQLREGRDPWLEDLAVLLQGRSAATAPKLAPLAPVIDSCSELVISSSTVAGLYRG